MTKVFPSSSAAEETTPPEGTGAEATPMPSGKDRSSSDTDGDPSDIPPGTDDGAYVHPALAAALSAPGVNSYLAEQAAKETDASDADESAEAPEPEKNTGDTANTAAEADEEASSGLEKISEGIVEGSSDVAAPPHDDEEEEKDEEREHGEDQPMSIRDHLRELRRRLFFILLAVFAGFFVCWGFAEPLFHEIMKPYLSALPAGQQKFMSILPTETFFTYMKVAFVGGIFLTSPFSFYQVWSFIAPGLHKEEKRYILPVSFFSALFFLAGAAFCYYIAFPYIFQFLTSFDSEIIEVKPNVADSLSFVLQLLLAFGFIFELPLFAFFLSRLGLITAAWMRKVRRYAILVNVVIAAILTPPDVVSQLIMAFPLLLLYELSILVAAVFGKKTEPEPAQAENDEEEDDDEE